MRTCYTLGILAALGLGLTAHPLPAQEAPAGPPTAREEGGDRGDRGDRGERRQGGEERERQGRDRRGDGEDRSRRNWDPAQMQERMMERLKDEIGAADDEWEVLQPKVARVMTAQRELRVGMPGGFARPGGRPGGPGGPPPEPTTELGKAARDLRETARGEVPTDADVTAKLATFRAAHAKATDELKAARADLKSVVTVQQEALLVLFGMLE